MGETDCFGNHERSYYDAMLSVWKNMTLIQWKELISVIGSFIADNPDGKSPWTDKSFLSFILFCVLEKFPI